MDPIEAELRAREAIAEAFEAVAADSPEQREAVRTFVRGTHITPQHAGSGADVEFITGYMFGVRWLMTRPPRSEAEGIDDLYRQTRPGGPSDQSSIYVNADDFPSFLAYVAGETALDAEYFEVEDGAKLKADMVANYGEHLIDTFNPPARTFVWASMHRLYEGLGQAVHHELEE